MASLIRGVQDLVVKDGEVKGETKTDRVSGRQLSLGNLGSSFVGFERLVCGLLASVTDSKLGQITVVVSLPI